MYTGGRVRGPLPGGRDWEEMRLASHGMGVQARYL